MQVNVPAQAPTPPNIFVGEPPTPPWVAPFFAFVILLIITTVLLYPLIRAWARRIERRGGDPMVAEELAQLRERVAELEQSGAHVAELEERLDFAERLLAQRSDVAQLPMHRTPA